MSAGFGTARLSPRLMAPTPAPRGPSSARCHAPALCQVLDARTGDPVWKLGDFDCCRRSGEPVHGFTAHYAAPELAAAELIGQTTFASGKMDIFSAGDSTCDPV